MSDSEVMGTEDLIDRIQNFLWEKSEHQEISKLTKKEGLVNLFRQIEQTLIDNDEEWYVKSDIDLDIREKDKLYADFAAHLLQERDRKKFEEKPSDYYNDNSKLPRWEFWAAVSRALRLSVTLYGGVEYVAADSILIHESIQVEWENLIETQENEEGKKTSHLNLGDDGSIMELWLPKFQRPRRWNSAKASILVESLKSGFPIPPFFVYKDLQNKRYVVLDGQQRIHALLETKGDWEGCVPSHSMAHVFVITSGDDAKDDDVRKALVLLYQRLNTGGVNLKPIEVRIGVHEDNTLLGELIKLVRDILSTEDGGGWKGHLASVFTPKRGGQSILETEENHLQAHELDLLDTLFRPLVYGTIDESIGGLAHHRLSTMKGLDQLLRMPYTADECKQIVSRLTNSFNAAYDVFRTAGCFLRMAKGRDEEGAIQWQPNTRVDKTATALQVGAFFSILKPRAELCEAEIIAITSRWLEFINSEGEFSQTGYLDDRGQPGRQNTGSLWGWQESWLHVVKPFTEHLVDQVPAVFTELNEKFSHAEIQRWLDESQN